MSWFGKKEDEADESLLPELPKVQGNFSLPELPKLNGEPNLPKLKPFKSEEIPHISSRPELNSLPSFPHSKTGDDFGKEVIKHAINEPVDEHEFKPSMVHGRRAIEIDEFEEPRTNVKKAEALFVKIDKFKSALENFERMKENVSEIEEALRKVKDIKVKEQEELDGWEREIQIIKSQIDSVDKTIFDKLED